MVNLDSFKTTILDIHAATENHLKYLLKKMKWLLGESYLSNQIELLLECETWDEAQLLNEKFKDNEIRFVIEEVTQPWEQYCLAAEEPYCKCTVKFDKNLVLYVNEEEIARVK